MEDVRARIKEIEDEMARTQKNKNTSYHLGRLKAQLAKLKKQLSMPKTGSKTVEGFEVAKTGIAQIGLVGFPSVGKSTLMSNLTGTESEIADYEFTTLTTVAGIIYHNGAKIQVLDLPGIIEGAKDGRGRGKQVIAAARACSMLLILLDVTRPLEHKKIIEHELEGFGIRINKKKPEIAIKIKSAGGIGIITNTKLTKITDPEIKAILSEYRKPNCDITFNCDADADELIDVLEGNRKYMAALYVLNKIDQISLQELSLVSTIKNSIPICAHKKWNFDELIDMVWENLNLIRIYPKPPKEKPDMENPVILMLKRRTIADFCNTIHKGLLRDFKWALVWGTSVKHAGQKVGKDHLLHDEDIIQIVKGKR